MSHKEFSDAIFEIADTLDMELTRTLSKTVDALHGACEREVRVFEGLRWVLKPSVLDSATHETVGKAAVLVHICGALYMLMVVDRFKEGPAYSQVWIIDGAKLGWSPQGVMLFPASWARDTLYSNVVEGVVASYQRAKGRTQWIEVAQPKQEMQKYILGKRKLFGQTQASSVVEKIKAEMQVSDKYRTKGPRDL